MIIGLILSFIAISFLVIIVDDIINGERRAEETIARLWFEQLKNGGKKRKKL